MNEAVFWATAVAILMACIAAYIFNDSRVQRVQSEIRNLETANDSLRAHFKAMSQLDDPAMPSELLDVALSLSGILNDRTAVDRIIAAFASYHANPAPQNEREERVHRLYNELVRHRPDLASAFTQAAMTGMIAVMARWPDSLAALRHPVLDVVIEPVDETMKVIRYAKGRPQPTSRFVPVAA